MYEEKEIKNRIFRLNTVRKNNKEVEKRHCKGREEPILAAM